MREEGLTSIVRFFVFAGDLTYLLFYENISVLNKESFRAAAIVKDEFKKLRLEMSV